MDGCFLAAKGRQPTFSDASVTTVPNCSNPEPKPGKCNRGLSRLEQLADNINFIKCMNAVLRRLQSLLNAVPRLITNIRQHIIFKIATFVRNSLHGRGQTYLSQSCIPISKIGARAHLRSAAWGHLTKPRTRTRHFGPRSFRVSGPAVWNSLPEDIANLELSLEHFKTGLKTHLFRLAYA